MFVAKDVASQNSERDGKMYKKKTLKNQVARFRVESVSIIFTYFYTCFNRWKEFVPTILNLDDDEELVFDLGMWGIRWALSDDMGEMAAVCGMYLV